MRALFIKTLRDLRGSIIGWSTGLGIAATFYVAVFPTVVSQSKALDDYWRSLPDALKSMMGEVKSLTTLEGFLRAEFLIYLPLLLAVFLIIKASATLTGEEDHRTIDVLMAQPISRRTMVLAKGSALAAAATIVTLVAGACLAATSLLVETDVSPWQILLACIVVLPAALVVGTVALAASCWGGRRKRTTLIATTFLVTSFFVHTLAPLTAALRPWRRASVFYWISTSRPMSSGTAPSDLLLLLVVSGALLAAAVALINRKEFSS